MLSGTEWEKECFSSQNKASDLPQLLSDEKLPKRLLLYGAGYGGLMFLELLRRHAIEPECLLDRSPEKQGRTIMGLPVKAPVREIVQGAVVIVCLLRMDKVYWEIKEQMESAGCQAVFHIYELRNDHTLFQGQRLILSPDQALLRENREKLYQVYRLLSDGLSRDTLTAIVKFLCGNLHEIIPACPMSEQYFAEDVYLPQENEVFVDCGAYTGEIIEQFLKRRGEGFSEYWAFEPDFKNIQALYTHIPKQLQNRFYICNTALGGRFGRVRVRNYDQNNSVICEDGESSSVCIPLDSFLDILRPTHLKVDVEGWETALLAGAKTMICRDRPVISIAVYHREEDFWGIPLLLKQWVPEYQLYLRSYMNVAETVLYAVPPERCVRRISP